FDNPDRVSIVIHNDRWRPGRGWSALRQSSRTSATMWTRKPHRPLPGQSSKSTVIDRQTAAPPFPNLSSAWEVPVLLFQPEGCGREMKGPAMTATRVEQDSLGPAR